MQLMGDNVKFGRKQLGNPTPRSIAWKIGLISAVGGFMIVFIQTSDWIGDVLQHVLSSVFSGVVGICNVVSPFFGVQSDDKKVDIHDVGVLEDQKN